MNHPTTLRFTRGNLPHWIVADATYFITFRIHGSLPVKLLDELRETGVSRDAARNADPTATLEWERRRFLQIDASLDAPDTESLRLSEADSRLIFENLDWLDPRRGWRIWAACVMPTHVHLLMRSMIGRSTALLDDLKQFKGYIARQINTDRESAGRFWAREDFDHWCRSQDKIESAARYIRENPVKARLVSHWRDWPWTRIRPDVFRAEVMGNDHRPPPVVAGRLPRR